jgi:hypothetical protein
MLLISNIKHFGSNIVHIQKEEGTFKTLCGKDLGFSNNLHNKKIKSNEKSK